MLFVRQEDVDFIHSEVAGKEAPKVLATDVSNRLSPIEQTVDAHTVEGSPRMEVCPRKIEVNW